MIVYELKCASGHVFEGWFRDAATFDRQAAAGKVACAECGDSQIAKAPMAPRLAKRSNAAPAETKPGLPAEAAKLLGELRATVESECDYVGERFSEEAGRMHYGEAEKRGIYGEASDAPAQELVGEGIEGKTIPSVPRGDA